MKFAHLADCHLDGWRIPELNSLNLASFQKAISICIKERVEFVLIAGDLFDSAYPSIDILKEAFKEFRRLYEARIPVFLIAGSHDYSVSGKSFLDVLEKSGFCKNVSLFEEIANSIILQPTIHNNVAIYGYPGKKSSLEIEDLERIKLHDCPGLFKILMLHTAIKEVMSNQKIRSVDETKLPKVNYLALGHLHISYVRNGKVYPGPIFPNNLLELEELKNGAFYIYNNGSIERRELKLKEVIIKDFETSDALNATAEIISSLEKDYIKDKILILKFSGILEQGKISDIDFLKIENYAKEKGAYTVLKNTSKLSISEPEIELDTINTEDIEVQIIKKFEDANKTKFNHLIMPLIKALQIEKLEEEKSAVFEERLLSEARRIVKI